MNTILRDGHFSRPVALKAERSVVNSPHRIPFGAPLAIRCSTLNYRPRERHHLQSGINYAHRAKRRCAAARASLSEALAIVTDTPLRDAVAVVFAIVGARALVKIFEGLEKAGFMERKLSRKLVHTLAGPLFLACWPLFSDAPYARYLAALVPSLNGIRLLLAGNKIVDDPGAVASMTRTGDPAELLRGPLYYVIVLLAVTALYWRNSSVGIVITSLMCGGDGLADIIGRKWGGTNPLPWNPGKSWAGSAAMFFGGLGVSVALVWYFSTLGFIVVDFPPTVAAVATISFVAAVIESLPINQLLDDNLSVPGVAALMGMVLLQVVVELL